MCVVFMVCVVPLSRYFFQNGKGSVDSHQGGVFRVNCMDSLDRTNVVQSMLARRMLQKQLLVRPHPLTSPPCPTSPPYAHQASQYTHITPHMHTSHSPPSMPATLTPPSALPHMNWRPLPWLASCTQMNPLSPLSSCTPLSPLSSCTPLPPLTSCTPLPPLTSCTPLPPLTSCTPL